MGKQFRLVALLAASICLVAASGWNSGYGADQASAPAASAAVQIDADDIGGVVSSSKGPEAGVWVIAETKELPTNFIKIVVTDDRGRYVLPDLPKAKYSIWVRGYGLVDSKPVKATPGAQVNLTAMLAPNPQAAADYYPADYWYSLIKPPAASEFPGTGSEGNGISKTMLTQQQWLGHMKENCSFCHQLGDMATRMLPTNGNSVEAWAHRIQVGTGDNSDPRIDMIVKGFRATMGNNMSRFGRERGLKMFADWTDRIAAGTLPPEAPPRPAGVERNVVLTLWGWSTRDDGTSLAIHDEISTDKRNPTVNANGPVYGSEQHFGALAVLDPSTNQYSDVKIPGLQSAFNIEAQPHNPMMDQKGRVWASMVSHEGKQPDYCTDGGLDKYAKYFPSPANSGRQIAMYDPATKKVTVIPTCFATHHIEFGFDKDNTVYFSGDTNLMGWVNTRVWDETHDAQKAQGWCPMVLDTKSKDVTKVALGGKTDVAITPDRTQWNQPQSGSMGDGEGAASSSSAQGQIVATDPHKDTRISGFLYGMGVNPVDNSVWYAKWIPTVPSGIVRFEPGANPPETCKTEYYEPPKDAKGNYAAFDARGVDLDSHGVAWVPFGTGQIASFDRRKCKVLSGPTATGQQCPEGWKFYSTPGPKVTGTNIGSDWHYLIWVDRQNVLGLGKDVPVVPGSNSDSLVAFLPDQDKFVVMRVPYPMSFYSRGLDGRIDDAKLGWKGRGIWADYGMSQVANLHIEGGEVGHLVKFQLRPDPLAH